MPDTFGRAKLRLHRIMPPFGQCIDTRCCPRDRSRRPWSWPRFGGALYSCQFLVTTLAPWLRRGSLFLPVPCHHPCTLAQRDLRLWPSSECRPIGCDGRFEIIDASDVLDDVVTGIIPDINAEREVGLRLHGAPLRRVACHGAGGIGKCYFIQENITRTNDGLDESSLTLRIRPPTERLHNWRRSGCHQCRPATALSHRDDQD